MTERATALMVTAVLLVVDTTTGAVRYAGAGHEAPLIARYTGGVEPLEAGGTILGLAGDTTFVEQEGRLDPGDALRDVHRWGHGRSRPGPRVLRR